MFGTGTARERADRALNRGAAWLSLADAVGDVGFWRVELYTDKRWMSPLAKRMLGFAEDVEISSSEFFALIHPDDRDRVAAAEAATRRLGVPLNEEFRVILADGADRLIHSAAQLQHEVEGYLLVGVIVDDTARRRAEREVREQQRQLTHLSRVGVLAALSGAIAHELNQPLSAILANARTGAKLLQSDNPGRVASEVREILEDIISADRRAADVLSRLRGLMRDSAPRLETIRPATLVSDVLAIARGDLRRRDVTTHVHVVDTIRNVRADRVQLQQVLLNLIVNACDAMEQTPAPDRALRISAEDQDGFVVFAVSDTGSGIAITPADRIFDPFVTSKEDGGGLGLAICRKIVYAHGGQIQAENDPAGGALVRMRIPATDMLPDEESDAAGAESIERPRVTIERAKASRDAARHLRVHYRMLLDQVAHRSAHAAGADDGPPGEERR